MFDAKTYFVRTHALKLELEMVINKPAQCYKEDIVSA